MSQINLPYNLQDGQRSSAPKLMANFESIINWANQGASSINAEIEGLNGQTVAMLLADISTKLANRYTKSEIESLLNQEIKDLVANITVDLDNGVWQISKKDGSAQSFDTALEKIPANFALLENGENVYLQITNIDGTTSQTDITSLLNIYNFDNSAQISFNSQGNSTKTVTAELRAQSVGLANLKAEVISELSGYTEQAESAMQAAAASAASLSQIEQNVANDINYIEQAVTDIATDLSDGRTARDSAQAAAITSDANALLARSYATGDSGSRDGEASDNAKYYAEQARSIAGGDFISIVEAEQMAADTLAAAKADSVPLSSKGQANGVAALNSSAKISSDNLPLATASVAGIISTGSQTIAGNKTFSDQLLPRISEDIASPEARRIYAGTVDMTPNFSPLPSGSIYLQYE